MDERVRSSGGDKPTDPIPREEKVRIVLGFSFGVPEQVVDSLARENGIKLGGRLTTEGLAVLTRAAEDWKNNPRVFGNNLNGDLEVSAGADAQSSPDVVGSSFGTTVSDVSRNGSPENQPPTIEKPFITDPDPAATRMLAARNRGPERRKGPPPNPIFANHTRRIAQPDSEPSVPVGHLNLAGVARMLNVTGEKAQEIVKEHGVDTERVEGINCYPMEPIAQIKKERDAKGEKGCPHHWKIESPNGPKSPGLCTYCGETRQFESAYEGW